MVKLAEIAEKTGFSIPVVSRVLSPRPDSNAKIAPKTRQLIQETAERMGYRPNRNAEFLKRGQNPVIGVFLPLYRNGLIVDLVMGISKAAQERGFPVSFVFETNFESYRKFIGETQGQQNCGIITYPHFKFDLEATELITGFSDKGGKVVMIEPEHFLPQIPHVELDSFYGGQIAAERLLAVGCEEFINMRGIPARTEGFCSVLEKSGKSPLFFNDSQENYLKILSICRESSRTIGIFCNTDRMAIRVHNILLRNGIVPGERIKLIGYDNLSATEHMSPALTTVHQPFMEVGILAVEKLVDLIYGQPVESAIIKPALIIRETA